MRRSRARVQRSVSPRASGERWPRLTPCARSVSPRAKANASHDLHPRKPGPRPSLPRARSGTGPYPRLPSLRPGRARGDGGKDTQVSSMAMPCIAGPRARAPPTRAPGPRALKARGGPGPAVEGGGPGQAPPHGRHDTHAFCFIQSFGATQYAVTTNPRNRRGLKDLEPALP